jgi:hypothetical protein
MGPTPKDLPARCTNEENYLPEADAGGARHQQCRSLRQIPTQCNGAGLAAKFGSGAMTNSVEESPAIRPRHRFHYHGKYLIIGLRMKEAVAAELS